MAQGTNQLVANLPMLQISSNNNHGLSHSVLGVHSATFDKALHTSKCEDEYQIKPQTTTAQANHPKQMLPSTFTLSQPVAHSEPVNSIT